MWTGLKDVWAQCGSLKLGFRKGKGRIRKEREGDSHTWLRVAPKSEA